MNNSIENSSHAEFQRRHMGMKAKNTISNIVIYAILIIMTIIWLFPFFCILCESFRMESTGQVGYILPHQFGFGNYIKLWTETDFPKWYGNTMIMALIVSVLQTVFVLTMSYTLSRLRFKGRKGLMNFMLVLGMFPGFLTMIVLYTVLKDLGLTGEHAVPAGGGKGEGRPGGRGNGGIERDSGKAFCVRRSGFDGAGFGGAPGGNGPLAS